MHFKFLFTRCTIEMHSFVISVLSQVKSVAVNALVHREVFAVFLLHRGRGSVSGLLGVVHHLRHSVIPKVTPLREESPRVSSYEEVTERPFEGQLVLQSEGQVA